MPHSSDTQVLYVAPFEPWCRENGSSLITADMLDALTEVKPSGLMRAFIRHAPRECAGPPTEEERGITLGREPLPLPVSMVLALLGNRSPWETRQPNRWVARRIAEAAAERGIAPDVVHIEHLPLLAIGRHLARRFGAPLVYRGHNIESTLWARRVGTSGIGRRWLTTRMASDEVRAIERTDLALCISEVDADWLRDRLPGHAIEVLPGALLMRRYEGLVSSDVDPDRIGFVGGLDWPPNERGLKWFVDDVLPSIVAARPAARLDVLARGAHDRPWLTGHPSIRVLPGETKPAELFAGSRMSIAPLLDGGGVRIKILETLAVGCPVVATRIGGEGIATPGLFSTSTSAEFAERCLDLFESGVSASQRADWRAAVSESHGAVAVARRLVDAWDRVAAGDVG